MRHSKIVMKTEKFLKAMKEAEKDECFCMNVGIHESKILHAWKGVLKEVNKIALLKGVKP